MFTITRSLASALVPACLAMGLAAEDLPTNQPPPREMAAGLGVELPRLPWHLADIWWNFAEPVDHFESVSVEVTIDRDIPDSYNLYISPVGIAEINGQKFYGGIQTNITGWASKESRTRIHPGKGVIFSRWTSVQDQPIGLDHVRMAHDGLCESAGYEGHFCSVRRPVAWTKGTYTYSIVRGDTETIGQKPQTWFHCLLRSHQSGITTWAGSLRFEGLDFRYWDRHAAFVEIYSTAKIPHSGIPRVKVTFGYPRINGVAPPLKEATAHYNPTSSPQCANANVVGDKVLVEVGEMFVRGKDQGVERLDLNTPH